MSLDVLVLVLLLLVHEILMFETLLSHFFNDEKCFRDMFL